MGKHPLWGACAHRSNSHLCLINRAKLMSRADAPMRKGRRQTKECQNTKYYSDTTPYAKHRKYTANRVRYREYQASQIQAPSIVITHNSFIQAKRTHSHIHQALQLYPLACTTVRGVRARCRKWNLPLHLHAIIPPEAGNLLGLQDCSDCGVVYRIGVRLAI